MWIVTFTPTFLTFFGPSIEQHELAEAPLKFFCNQVVPILLTKGTAAVYPPKRSENCQKRPHFFGHHFAQFSQKFDKAGLCL